MAKQSTPDPQCAWNGETAFRKSPATQQAQTDQASLTNQSSALPLSAVPACTGIAASPMPAVAHTSQVTADLPSDSTQAEEET